MKQIITLIIICAGAVQNFELDKINGILGTVQIIEFDSDSNIYIGSNLPSDAAIYKLNSAKQVIVKHEGWLVYVESILTTNSNNAYLFDNTNGGGIFFIGRNESSMDRLYEFPMNDWQVPVYFMDKKDNIYLNTANGVAVIKPKDVEARGISVPKCVENLENFSITNEFTYAIDYLGNIYLGGTFNGDSAPKIAVILNYEQDKLVPSAKIYDAPNLNLKTLSSIGIDPSGGNALVAFSGNQARIYKLNPDFQLIFGEYLYNFSSLYSTEDKFYFFAENIYIGGCYLHVGYYDYQKYSYNITALPNSFSDLCNGANFTSDSVGNIYFASKKEVFLLRNNAEMNLEKIIFPAELQYKITALLVDDNDNLWILAGNLYVARKNLLGAMQYTYTPFAIEEGVMKLHPETKEIFIGSENGLYVFSEGVLTR